MRIYLDASPVVYMVERVAEFLEPVRARLSIPDLICVASELTRLECRVKPIQRGDGRLLQEYEQFFDQSVDEIVELTREVMDLAAEIRAKYSFKTPDAIHLAAAVAAACDVFLTNDRQLARFDGIRVEPIVCE